MNLRHPTQSFGVCCGDEQASGERLIVHYYPGLPSSVVQSHRINHHRYLTPTIKVLPFIQLMINRFQKHTIQFRNAILARCI
jgi:hypothetical protein